MAGGNLPVKKQEVAAEFQGMSEWLS